MDLTRIGSVVRIAFRPGLQSSGDIRQISSCFKEEIYHVGKKLIALRELHGL